MLSVLGVLPNSRSIVAIINFWALKHSLNLGRGLEEARILASFLSQQFDEQYSIVV